MVSAIGRRAEGNALMEVQLDFLQTRQDRVGQLPR